ncbi:Aminoglycoside phosphotransferase [Cordyceps javanica]|nr:Aminoglycoside phosphotransferase [Cordyceps javanica]
MATRDLLSGPITLSAAQSRSSNILHSLRYPALKAAFYAHIESHRALITDIIAHHFGVSPSIVDVAPQAWWRHGSFNLGIPGRILEPGMGVPAYFFIRFPLPYRNGELSRPGNGDEKLRCEAATYAFIEENCPGVQYTNCAFLPWWKRWLQAARRAFISALGRKPPTCYITHNASRFAPLDTGYLLIELIDQSRGEMLSESWDEYSTDPKRLDNLQRGLARMMLSLASVELPRIGAFQLDHDGYLRLDNRPISVTTTMHENESLPLDLPRHRTMSSSTELVLSQLAAFESRMVHQPNGINSEGDGWYQMAAFVGARLALPQLLRKDLERGPFVLALTDLHRSNIMVDKDWNVTCVIDLEYACAWPVEFWHSPNWLDSDYIDTMDRDQFAARHELFIRYVEEEEKHSIYRAGRESLSSIMHKAWDRGTVWVELALRDPVAFTAVFYQKILPVYFGFLDKELDNGSYFRFCSRFWSLDMPTIIERKLRDHEEYLDKLKAEFPVMAEEPTPELSAARV